MHSLKSIGIVLFTGILISINSGCCLTFAGLTAIHEEQSKHEARIPLDELREVAPGVTVRVDLKSGSTEEGKVVEMVSLPEGPACV